MLPSYWQYLRPVGDLRFTVPQPMNESVHDAKESSQHLYSIEYPMSEACLTEFWVHGGGFYMGSGSDERYIISAIVANSYRIGKLFVAVSLNPRLSAWDFLSSSDVISRGNTNLLVSGIKENIGVFNGDPDMVRIWGESAGAVSVGTHVTTYGGRDDGLFPYSIRPVVDNDLDGFVKAPILAGTNTEGTSFGLTAIDAPDHFCAYPTDGTSGFKLPPSTANRILDLYPDDPSQSIPEFLGAQRVSAKVADVPYLSGAAHFEGVAFVFNNITGLGYHYGKPFAGMHESYGHLRTLMASMWVSFIHDLDPNSGIKNEGVRWQSYGANQPVDLVFHANVTSYMEPDTWRKGGIDYINSIAKAYLAIATIIATNKYTTTDRKWKLGARRGKRI
ncbi:Alpha/Beta hydrolase protein [Aspergillus coremiiformis]|uniref:Alpha/Beta hydrolase protein n=1 Tax=Aspergillus coremiiformis TaxID=138285 RepID=A0A5N6Z0Z6_9EURO|nr:Alpha/Beta hydrolase protein [Aspergillus coremiiformis]